MNKRLRKKLRIGEFRELGFELRLTLVPDLSEGAVQEALDDFMCDAIEDQDLAVGGGFGEHWNFFVTSMRPGSVTDEQRERVLGWLEKDPRFARVEASPMMDAWYQTWDFDAGVSVPMR